MSKALPELDNPKFRVFSKSGRSKATPTGGTYLCRLEGCRGMRVVVRWSNNIITHPCSKGMKTRKDGNWQIL